MFVGCRNSTVADLVNPPPVSLVILQHAGPQHIHHLWKLFIHEGGSETVRKRKDKDGENGLLLKQ